MLEEFKNNKLSLNIRKENVFNLDTPTVKKVYLYYLKFIYKIIIEYYNF